MDNELSKYPLARLRQLAKEGPDAATRSAAQREIESRLGGSNQANVASKVAVHDDHVCGKIPTLELRFSGTTRREIRATVYSLCAAAERKLATMPEQWEVVPILENPYRTDPDPCDAAVEILLMGESDNEIRLACALLTAIQPAQAAKRRGRKPGQKADKREKKADNAKSANGAKAAATA